MPEQIPRTPAQVASLAKDVYEKLVVKYAEKGDQFVDSGQPQTGLIFRCAGSVALLLLANSFEEVGADTRWRTIVYRELDEVHKHIQQKGYDATPYVTEDNTERLFSKSSEYYYTDSLSWVLSMTILIRVAAHRLKRFKGEPAPPTEFLSQTYELMKDALTKICDAACEKGGWNFSNGCTEPHLYYSFAVSEALADFGDYVLGETPQIFEVQTEKEAEDKDLRKDLGGDLIGRVIATRKKLLEYLREVYVPQLSEDEIEHVGLPLLPNEKRHLLLYYTYFVLEMLVTCNLPTFHPEWEDELDEALEIGIYRTRIDLNRAMKDKTDVEKPGDKPWFEDPDKSTLWIRDWFSFKEPDLFPPVSKRTIGEPSLIPLSVRCNAQYAYWVADGTDERMPKLFGLLLDDRNPKDGLWDDRYDLLITERAIEAIVDYFDYVTKYESRHESGPAVIQGESVLDRSFTDVIKMTVKDFFDSADGQALLLQATRGVSPGSPEEPEGASAQLKKLASNLGIANRARRDRDKSELQKEVADLDQAFTVMLDELVYEWLSSKVKNQPDKLKKLRKAVDLSKKAIPDSLGGALAANPDIAGKSLVSIAVDYLIQKATIDYERSMVDSAD